MVGIFGQFSFTSNNYVNTEGMERRIPKRFETLMHKGDHFSIGLSNHDLKHGSSVYKGKKGSFCLLLGEIFNFKPGIATNYAEYLYDIIINNRLEKLADINGLFSAIVVQADKKIYTFVNDKLGSWPLFMWKNKNVFVFSTNLYTLLGCSKIQSKPNPMSVVQLFSMQRTFGNVTPIQDIEYSIPASIIEITKKRISKKKYWQFNFKDPRFKRKEAPYVLAEALKKSMLLHGDGGLLLSGGLDSRLLLAASTNSLKRCWTSASYSENPELMIARNVAEIKGIDHKSIIIDPTETLKVLEQTVKANNGMYPASTPMSAFLPQVALSEKTILTGHGLDYTFRGFYMPTKFLEFAGSRTRIPLIKSFGKNITGKDVFENLRQGPPMEVVERIFGGKNNFVQYKNSTELMFSEKLKPWLSSKYPENAWDAFILESVSQHYAFTSMMAVRDVGVLRIPAFDDNVFNVYLNLLPAWRVSGQVAIKALEILSPELSKFKNSNTFMRANLNPTVEISTLILRGVMRRFGFFKPPVTPTKMHSYGSWQNSSMMYRLDKDHKKRFKAIKQRLDWLSCGILSVDNLNKCIDEHMNFEYDHPKLLRQLLTHDAWMRVADSL